jgi:Tol biopolymer transport system component
MNGLKKYFFLFLSVLLISSCKSGTSSKPGSLSVTTITPLSTPTPQIEQLNNAEQLTFIGDNHHGQISEDNTKILFASRLRVPHKEFQVYELNLTSNREDRLSFNDGTANKPIYGNTKNVVYFASNTDENKELTKKDNTTQSITPPFSFYDPSHSLNHFEIYLLDLNDRKNIPERLTEHLGYDNEPQAIDNNQIAYIQQDEKEFHLQKWVPKNKKTQIIFQQEEPIWSPKWNKNRKEWVWISWTTDPPVKTFVFSFKEKSKQPDKLNLPDGLYHDVAFSSNDQQLLLSAQLNNKTDFDIYFYDFKENCLRPIVSAVGDDIEPTINKKNSFIVFSHRSSANNGTHFQLYKKNLSQDQEPCIESAK